MRSADVGTRSPVFNLLVVAMIGMSGVCGCHGNPDLDQLADSATVAIRKHNLEQAEELIEEILAEDPKSAIGLRLAGNVAEERGDARRAVGYYKMIPGDQRLEAAAGRCRAAQLLVRELGQLSEAERQFRLALSFHPNHRPSLDGLAYLLSITGRRWEASRYYLNLVRMGQSDEGHLLGLAVAEFMLNEEGQLTHCRRQAPDDPLPLLGLARLAISENQEEQARDLLHQAIGLDPELAEAQARYGHLLVDARDETALREWHAALPESVDTHPEIWVVRGRWAELRRNTRAAIRCYLEALRRAPNHQLAAARLAVELFAADRPELANVFAARSQALLRLHEVIFKLRTSPDDIMLISQAATLLEQQRRFWEASAWYELLLSKGGRSADLQQRARQIRVALHSNDPQMPQEANPAWSVTLSDWPMPEWSVSAAVTMDPVVPPPGNEAVRFEDMAEAAGLDFQYYNGSDPRKIGTRIYEVDGGGIAVLDYDQDGWPDIYFTQGCRWPPDPDQEEFFDRLYRNLGDGTFVDVTQHAGLAENGFGQGLTVGDIDNDGYPDLLVGNLGANHLYHNQGDGTFRDATGQAGLIGSRWTSSCLIADLNRDRWPEIYEVNYLQDDGRLDRICPDANGHPRICAPVLFDAEQDSLYLNQGDGTFRECGESAGIHVAGGKGLGIVAADFHGTGSISLFVANDVVENFFFRNEVKSSSDRFVLTEEALVRGVAFADDGQAQACMGVAADDFDLDGRLDLFVTNFYDESNCLYMQQPDGSFADRSRSANLRTASFRNLGFGTQAVDGDLDGWPDLIVTNGHLVDETDLGIPYRMRPQYFGNRARGRFVELDSEALGQFFLERRLGRSLARLDWNRDGREDFAVSFLDRPVALVTNQAQLTAHFLSVQLRGTRSSRDAIGAMVTVERPEWKHVRQQTAGDGYQASNERQLIFGLGYTAAPVTVHIMWPSGTMQTWQHVPVDSELILVEGDSTYHARPR